MEVRRNRLLGRYVTMAVLMALAGLLGYRFSERTGMARLQVEASYRLDLFAMTIESIVNRYAHVPTTIELREDVIAALRTPGDSALVDRTNRYLAQLSARIGSIGIFLLGTDGVTLASSNWSRPDNLIGEDLSFRPYFRTAIAGGALRYYAIGNTEGAPGYFVSYSVRDGAEIVGVAVVKIGLSAVERSWLPLGAPALIADGNGVVVLSSEEEWRFASLGSLGNGPVGGDGTPLLSRQPGGNLPIVVEENYADQTQRVSFAITTSSGGNGQVGQYLAQSRSLPETGWRLILFSDLRPVRAQALNDAALAAMATGFVMLLLLYINQRRRILRQRLETQAMLESANAELESKVGERTTDLTAANAALRAEIVERERAEVTLRAAQDELVQAAKLAVLGRLATGITHELTQPLGAMRTLSGNAIEFLRRGQIDTAQANLDIIGKLADQMGGIIDPLKTFARKSPARAEAVDVSIIMGRALFLLAQRAQRESVEVRNLCKAGEVIAWCDPNRLQQVLVNLVGNALDAMSEQSQRVLTLSAEVVSDGRVLVRVADSGPGLDESVRARLFEPFFTTKPPGEGLGLGLAISQDIVREFGGSLRGEGGGDGAVFTVELPADRSAATAQGSSS